jgi:hypothetical protein
MKGCRIAEIPITFVDRRSGYSKMSNDIFKEAVWMVWKLAIRNKFKRSPSRRISPPEPELAGLSSGRPAK